MNSCGGCTPSAGIPTLASSFPIRDANHCTTEVQQMTAAQVSQASAIAVYTENAISVAAAGLDKLPDSPWKLSCSKECRVRF